MHLPTRRLLARPMLTVLVGVLTACGGGGSGGDSTAATPAPAPPASTPTPEPTPPGTANAAPAARFELTPATGGNAPLIVSVNASGAADSDGQITDFRWRFGDGSPEQSAMVTQHVYRTPGTYTIELRVTDDEGASSVAIRTLTVAASTATATISGTISILPSSAVDADVNDRFTQAVSNNSFDTAQPVSNPLTLGGFANVPGTGAASGNLFSSGDPHDFYRVELSGQEQILLTIGDPGADLDLALWDANRALVDSSVGSDKTETLSVNTAGVYFIEVFPFAGASNYVLNVGLAGTALGATRPVQRISDPFAVGELIVTRLPTGTAAAAATAIASPSKPRPELVQLAKAVTGVSSGTGAQTAGAAIEPKPDQSLSQTLSPTLSRSTRQASQRDAGRKFAAGARVSDEQRARLNTLLTAKAMNAMDGTRAEVNALRLPLAVPDDPFYVRQWHYENINLPLAWDLTTGSDEVIVAVVDSGVLLNHPDLNGRLIAGYDFVANLSRSNDGDGIDPDPNDPGDLALSGSSSFHGTHVAGTIGAETNNGAGSSGVDWAARIMPMRALGIDGGTTFDVIQAMRFAAGLTNNSNTLPAQRADIINLSLGSEFSSPSEQAAIDEIRNLGIMLIASAGNASSSLPSFPAAYDGVVSVAATTINNTQAPYSNFGASIDVAAPGGNNGTDINGDGIGDGVISTIGDDGAAGNPVFGYAAVNGTSMAAPHVAGVAALMKAVHPGLTPTEFDTALAAGELTVDLGTPGRDDLFGFGLIDARRAVLTAIELANGQGIDPGPILSASNSSLNFGSFGARLTLSFSNAGTGALALTSVTDDRPWLSVSPLSTNPDGTGSYEVSIDRSGLADGSYTGTVSASSDAGTVSVRIIMQVQSANEFADAGLHFVLLIDENSRINLPAAIVEATNGEYRFSISDVPYGQYQLIGGTDSDDDNFLCDDGESCGAFRTLEAPETLTVNGDVTDVDFVSEYRLSLEAVSIAGQDKAADGSPSGIPLSKPEPSP